MALPATCSECISCHPIDELLGNCKKGHAERHIKPTDGCTTEVLNGWPVVNLSEVACSEGEVKP